jgi:hypothetical protein
MKYYSDVLRGSHVIFWAPSSRPSAKDGSTGYSAQMVIKCDMVIVHRESKRFDRKQAVTAWLRTQATPWRTGCDRSGAGRLNLCSSARLAIARMCRNRESGCWFNSPSSKAVREQCSRCGENERHRNRMNRPHLGVGLGRERQTAPPAPCRTWPCRTGDDQRAEEGRLAPPPLISCTWSSGVRPLL